MRKYKVSDALIGSWRSIISGTAGNMFETQRQMKIAHDERVAREGFGDGTVGGTKDQWTPPVHGTTLEGRPVTISFGTGGRAGHTLVCDGHITDMNKFYGNAKTGKGHDHYLVDGQIASRVDRRRFL